MAELPNPDDAFDLKKQDAIEEAMKSMSREEAALFVFLLKSKYQKRKLQLTGYIVGLVVWLAGMLFALAMYGTSDGFIGWVFLVPFFALGVTLLAFGKWSERIGNRAPPPDLVQAVQRKQK